jgi:hypothetical protein
MSSIIGPPNCAAPDSCEAKRFAAVRRAEHTLGESAESSGGGTGASPAGGQYVVGRSFVTAEWPVLE